jgi:lysophospholipase L1-like esterase
MRQFLRGWSSVLGAALLAGALGIASPVSAEPRAPTLASEPAPWQEAFDAFAAADRANPPGTGGVVFVGSSSIRLWDGLETQFERLPVVLKRGFGGSHMADCAKHLQRLVLAYKPSTVVVYAGENDLADGATPEDVLASFKAFADGVRRAQPQTHIAYLSIKPSPLRESLMPRIRATNALIRDYVGSLENAQFIDVHTQMVDAQGHVRRELFREDHLHLNADGYALWRREIAARLP